MAIKPLDHYSITNIKPSVYEEESMTALELVGRIGQRLNEAIAAYNALERETINRIDEEEERITNLINVGIPNEIKQQVDIYIKHGEFDKAINLYLDDLEGRVNNLLGAITEGSTTMDAEVMDGRVGGNIVTYKNLGEAIREQYKELSACVNELLSIAANKYGYERNLNRRSLWEQGWISSETGEPGNTGMDFYNFIRTRYYIPVDVERIISPIARLEIYIYDHSDEFLRKEEIRHADYTFDHENFKYRIHATGYEENIVNYHSTKTGISLDDSATILMLSKKVEETNENLNVFALDKGYQRDINYRSLWSQGYIYGTNGTDGIDPHGCDYWLYSRSDILPGTIHAVCAVDGYKARLFRYKDGEFIDYVNVGNSPVKLNHNTYDYRLDVTYTANELGNRNDVNDMWRNVMLLADEAPDQETGETRSPFDKGLPIDPITINGFYNDTHDHSFEFRPLQTYDELCQFNMAVADEEKIIGKSSDGRDILAYYFHRPYIDGSVNTVRPKIIIVGGQHGFEKANVMAISYFMQLLFHASEEGELEELTQLCETFDFIFVPVTNPYGYDNAIYKNANGVNLNRNYDYKWVEVSDPTTDHYGGEAPFDQPETRAIRDLILNEENVVLVIDSHSKGSGAVPSTRDMNWIVACGETDPYYSRLSHVARRHLSALRRHSVNNPPYAGASSTVGYFEGFDGKVNTVPSLDNWCVYNNKIMSLTFEGFNAMPDEETLYSPDTLKLNTLMLINFILRFAEEYSRR